MEVIVKRINMLLILLSLLCLVCACGQGGTKVVLTMGFAKDEIFRIETMSCTKPELMVYLTTTQNQYEEVYGPEIWQASLDGVTVEENIKETVLAKIAQIKTLNLLAVSKQIGLDEEEKDRVKLAAAAYYDSLSPEEIETLAVSRELIEQMYREYALAQKVYSHIIRDINPEISDDEARIITVQHILIKTYIMDGSGLRVEYTKQAKALAYTRAEEALNLALEGTDFTSLVELYNEDTAVLTTFGKGELSSSVEAVAFKLGTNEISGIIEDEQGYHILKCLSTFDREETDRNKLKIVEERRKEVFGEEYDAFVETLTRKLNDELWAEIGFLHDENVTTSDFFDIYLSYFPEE